MDDYVRALLKEIDCSGIYDAPVRSVYFGGGTPTLLSPGALAAVLEALSDKFDLSSDCEITLEANPGTVNAGSLSLLWKAGFNRLSLGIQSLDPGLLRSLGRIHTPGEARLAAEAALKAGFCNLNLDIMYRLPGQTMEMLERDLTGILELCPRHISAYELTIAEGTPFGLRRQEIEQEILTDAKDASDFLWGVLSANGYERYEVSNYSLRGCRSRHNLNYWRRGEYYGFGAGAWSFVAGSRNKNISPIPEYIRRVGTSGQAVEYTERLKPEEELTELLMLGLRTTEGVRLKLLKRYSPEADAILARAVSLPGLLINDGESLRCTRRGLDLLNYILETIL